MNHLTSTNNNAGGATLEFQHPDRLGTKLITNPQANTSFEQTTLPFGTSLSAETTGTTNERFTSYDRSAVASVDYAVNRSYSPAQGRFTQVDPMGMSATDPLDPQSNNLYVYTGNNPIDFTDPSGLIAGPLPDFVPEFEDWAGERGFDPLTEYLRGSYSKIRELGNQWLEELFTNLISIGNFEVTVTAGPSNPPISEDTFNKFLNQTVNNNHSK